MIIFTVAVYRSYVTIAFDDKFSLNQSKKKKEKKTNKKTPASTTVVKTSAVVKNVVFQGLIIKSHTI